MRRRRGPIAVATLAAGISLAISLAACGEADYDASGLVADLNEAGAGLALGAPLSGSEDAEVTEVNFEDGGGGPGEPTAGAIVILGDADAASGEFQRCESAVDFVCFRVANAVLRFSNITPEQRQRMVAAASSLQSE